MVPSAQAGAAQATIGTAPAAEDTAAMLLGTKATAAVTVIAAPATTAKIRRLLMAHSPGFDDPRPPHIDVRGP
ncbi:hypothetical protein GCM10009848_21720 [Micromonospora lupini]